jgi:hypothetical protein
MKNYRYLLLPLLPLLACSGASEAPKELEGRWTSPKESSCRYALTLDPKGTTYESATSCILNQTSAEVEIDRGSYEILDDGSLLCYPQKGTCSGLLAKRDARLPFVLTYRFISKGQLLVEYPTKVYVLGPAGNKDASPVNLGCFQGDFFVESPIAPY